MLPAFQVFALLQFMRMYVFAGKSENLWEVMAKSDGRERDLHEQRSHFR